MPAWLITFLSDLALKVFSNVFNRVSASIALGGEDDKAAEFNEAYRNYMVAYGKKDTLDKAARDKIAHDIAVTDR